MAKSFITYQSTKLAAGAIKQLRNFGTLFACERIAKNDGTANAGGIDIRLDGGSWMPWYANRGFRLDDRQHTIEIKNASAISLTVGYYYGEADMFPIS